MVEFNLYLITDRIQAAGRGLPAVVADALAGGVRAIQLREKDLSSRQLFELALQLRELTCAYDALLLINDRLDIARAVGADGVHVGVQSMPVSCVREHGWPGMLIGYSAHRVDEAIQAELSGADFVTFGPVYHTPSKIKYGDPVGLSQLSAAASSLTVPVFALGGVKKTTIADVMATGCSGVAMISEIICAADPRHTAGTILEEIEKHVIQT